MNRTITHVCVARPHFLDLAVIPVSDVVKRIVDYINSKPKCSRRQLVEALAPSPPLTPIPVPAEGQPAVVPETAQPTPEQTSVIADLHWLIHQGHVIEFANGVLECAKKPLPKPPKPAAKPEQAPAAETPVEGAPPAEGAVPVESSGTEQPGTSAEPGEPTDASAPTSVEQGSEAIPGAPDFKVTEAPSPIEAPHSAADAAASHPEPRGTIEQQPESANVVETPVNSVASAS